MKAHYNLIILFLFSNFIGYSQNQEDVTNSNNSVEVSYLFMDGVNRSSEHFNGHGFELIYSRNLWRDKIYATVSWGKAYTSSDDEMLFWIDRDDNPMRILTAGIGYNFFKNEKLTVSGEISYLSLRHKIIDYMLTDSDGNVGTIYYGKRNDQTLRFQVKAKYEIIENFAVVPVLGYGFQNQQYETMWLKLGVAYTF